MIICLIVFSLWAIWITCVVLEHKDHLNSIDRNTNFRIDAS